MESMSGGQIIGSLLPMMAGLNTPEMQEQVKALLRAIAETHAAVKRIEGYLIETGQLAPPQPQPQPNGGAPDG